MKKPEISVVVPMFNAERYILNTIGSIQDQSFEQFELICVDDGSTDSTVARLKDGFSDARIRIVKQKNKGLGGARNTGIAESVGKWITFIDADDTIHPDFLKKLYAKAEQGYDIVDCGHSVILADGSLHSQREHRFKDKEKHAYKLILSGRAPTQACSRLYLRQLFEGPDYLFPENTIHEDLYNIWKVYHKAQKVVSINDSLYFWLRRTGSLSRSMSKKHIDDVFNCFFEDQRYAIINNIYEECQYELARRPYHYCLGILQKLTDSSVKLSSDNSDKLKAHLVEKIVDSPLINSKTLRTVLGKDRKLISNLDRLHDIGATSLRLQYIDKNATSLLRSIKPKKVGSSKAAELKIVPQSEKAAELKIVPQSEKAVHQYYGTSWKDDYQITFVGLLLKLYRKFKYGES